MGSPYFTFIHYNREGSLQKIWSGHNILRLFDVLPNFVSPQENGSVIGSNKRGIYELPHELPNNIGLTILEN